MPVVHNDSPTDRRSCNGVVGSSEGQRCGRSVGPNRSFGRIDVGGRTSVSVKRNDDDDEDAKVVSVVLLVQRRQWERSNGGRRSRCRNRRSTRPGGPAHLRCN
jgi:hypothetical protein